MGIDANALRFLLYAKSFGVDFTSTATIGRQRLDLSFKRFCTVMASEFNCDADARTLEQIYNGLYAERLLEFLGAHEIHSIDASPYEGATRIHDFNTEISDEYVGRYTALIDGGTLEHIFNFPVAIKNCMQMLRVGGRYLGMSPTNNFSGHGFYQFSPELYFRVFCRENGFRVEHMIVHEQKGTKKWFSVADPDVVKSRVRFKSRKPTLLFILATREADVPIFSAAPQQSDYAREWQRGDTRGIVVAEGSQRSARKSWFARFARTWRRVFKGRGPDPAFFTPIRLLGAKAASDGAPERTAQKPQR